MTMTDRPKCKSIYFQKKIHNHALLQTNKQICAESIAILSSISSTLSRSMVVGTFKDKLQAPFNSLLADSKVFFNCHVWELYAFL
jgi:hypothetical protein